MDNLDVLTMGKTTTPEKYPLQEILHTTTCPACGYFVAVTFYPGGRQPLTTLAWPKSQAEAQGMKRLPLSFVRCVECGHVYNTEFDYQEVPYSEKPNLMFNQGTIWHEHLKQIRNRIKERWPENPVVVEIGCGDGHLLRALKAEIPSGRFIGFDPHSAIETQGGAIEAQAQLFDPMIHLAEYQPHLIISRHVLEHLMNPLGFVQSLAFAANWHGLETQLCIEVPCIDRVFGTFRATDFFYEHNSHFTTHSLTRLLSRSCSKVTLVERGYNDEVLYGFAAIGSKPEQLEYAHEALRFMEQTKVHRTTITEQLNQLYQSGKRIALWGGTGKAAAFINRYGLEASRFPIVVDSDIEKVGTFVPGGGQEIRFPTYLVDHPVEVIVITTQWRAKDIALEIQRRGISFESLLLEHDGQLVNYLTETHPYNQ